MENELTLYFYIYENGCISESAYKVTSKNHIYFAEENGTFPDGGNWEHESGCGIVFDEENSFLVYQKERDLDGAKVKIAERIRHLIAEKEQAVKQMQEEIENLWRDIATLKILEGLNEWK